MTQPIKIGVLISGGGSNLQAILDACKAGRINGRVSFVGADRPGCKGLLRAQKEGIPTFEVEYGTIIRQYRTDPELVKLPPDCDWEALLEKQTLFPKDTDPTKLKNFFHTRVAAEVRLLKKMAALGGFDLLVLAGFMRTLTPYFIDAANGDDPLPKIMNIHPALLPAFPGTDGYGDTFRYGCKIGGCTVHFIDYGEDSGPIIGQRSFTILPEDDLDAVKKRGLEEEWKLYPGSVELFAQGRLKLEQQDGRMVVKILSIQNCSLV